MTETCNDETPHLITHVETTPATTYDEAVVETIHAALAEKGFAASHFTIDWQQRQVTCPIGKDTHLLTPLRGLRRIRQQHQYKVTIATDK